MRSCTPSWCTGGAIPTRASVVARYADYVDRQLAAATGPRRCCGTRMRFTPGFPVPGPGGAALSEHGRRPAADGDILRRSLPALHTAAHDASRQPGARTADAAAQAGP